MSSAPCTRPPRLRRGRDLAFVLATSLAVVTATPAGAAPPGTTAIQSRPAIGSANGESNSTYVSDDGTVVVFRSAATNLLPVASTPHQAYATTRNASGQGTVEKVSVSSNEVEANGQSRPMAVSATGRFVVFGSHATNLVPGDTNGLYDLFLRDRQLTTTVRLSVTSQGKQVTQGGDGWAFDDADVTPDGRYVVFAGHTTSLDPVAKNPIFSHVFVRDQTKGTTTLASVAPGYTAPNQDSGGPSISDDGNLVAFHSVASNLVAGDTNNEADVFVRNRALGTTKRVGLTTQELQATGGASSNPMISADGTRVLFLSTASNLVTGDTNKRRDAFVRHLSLETTRRVSLSDNSQQLTHETPTARLSADGNTVVFRNEAPSVVANQPGCACIYRRGTYPGGQNTSLAAITAQGEAAPLDWAGWPNEYDVSGNGKVVAFSAPDSVTSGDTNDLLDVAARISP